MKFRPHAVEPAWYVPSGSDPAWIDGRCWDSIVDSTAFPPTGRLRSPLGPLDSKSKRAIHQDLHLHSKAARPMAKKPDFNQSAEIRSILQELGKEAKFKDVFQKLRERHRGFQFNENACQQAFSIARKKLGFVKGPKAKRVVKPKGSRHRVGGVRGAVGKGVLGIENRVLEVIRAAKELIALTGDTEAAKAVIDHM